MVVMVTTFLSLLRLLQRRERLLCAGDVSGLQIAADLAQSLLKRSLCALSDRCAGRAGTAIIAAVARLKLSEGTIGRLRSRQVTRLN